MSFNGGEDHSISLTDAAALTANYRNSQSTGAILGEYFGKDAINSILSQTGCVGIRIYYGQDTTGVKKLVITGVDSNGDDLYNGTLAERGFPCPPTCSTSNPLNSSS
jgi:hypothetical protein